MVKARNDGDPIFVTRTNLVGHCDLFPLIFFSFFKPFNAKVNPLERVQKANVQRCPIVHFPHTNPFEVLRRFERKSIALKTQTQPITSSRVIISSAF